jgi:AMP deaminase
MRWLIQIPRLHTVYRKSGDIANFKELLDNIFVPLFEVTVDPSVNPSLHLFLKQIVGFDCVDDESKNEVMRFTHTPQTPEEWTSVENPPYSYWLYYIYANLITLNKLRESKGFTTFSLRPHCGEAGDVNHLVSGFMLSESINHGIMLSKSSPLQYLFYLEQIGLAVSPLSNNKLFVDYYNNPFYKFFSRGLNVSLSTDDPLMLHFTKEPLVEEYVVAAQVWKLSSTDLCEIARNSVLQSGFEHPFKAHWIGERYFLAGPDGNDIHLTNVPSIRLRFRYDLLDSEITFVQSAAASGLAPMSPEMRRIKKSGTKWEVTKEIAELEKKLLLLKEMHKTFDEDASVISI